jgi:hypothetical protein
VTGRLLITAALLCGAAGGKPMDTKLALQAAHDAAEQAFAKVEGFRGVSLRTTPPFPAAWPPDGSSVVYAYATRFDPSLRDAERTSQPWGRVRIDAKGQVSLEHAEKALGRAEPQGFRPVSKDDPVLAARAAAQASVLTATSLEALDAAQVRAFYCAWLRYNGVVAKSVRVRHEAFVKWLECR